MSGKNAGTYQYQKCYQHFFNVLICSRIFSRLPAFQKCLSRNRRGGAWTVTLLFQASGSYNAKKAQDVAE